LYQKANSYHNIIIFEDENRRIFTQNLWYSSGIDINTKESFFSYIKEIKQKLINWKFQNIAIIWAAGFTLPQELSKLEWVKNIDVVDVDKELKDISEKYFLQEKIGEKVNFIVQPARYFLNNSVLNSQLAHKNYDAIVIDIYVWASLPPQTLTFEFYGALTQISDNIFINLITDTSLESDFSKNVFATMKKAFWNVYYRDVNWNEWYETNFVITNKYFPWYLEYKLQDNVKIYTDDKNSVEIDLFEKMKYKK
jgi:spermidine synthase